MASRSSDPCRVLTSANISQLLDKILPWQSQSHNCPRVLITISIFHQFARRVSSPQQMRSNLTTSNKTIQWWSTIQIIISSSRLVLKFLSLWINHQIWIIAKIVSHSSCSSLLTDLEGTRVRICLRLILINKCCSLAWKTTMKTTIISILFWLIKTQAYKWHLSSRKASLISNQRKYSSSKWSMKTLHLKDPLRIRIKLICQSNQISITIGI